MNRKFILIGLLMAVFAFPFNDSFVFAGCKGDKRKLRAEKKESIRSLCEDEILPHLDKLTNHKLNEHENARFCRDGDWSVKTNPRGGCGNQKANIRKNYNNKIDSLEAFLVDTQKADKIREENQRICDALLPAATEVRNLECQERCSTWTGALARTGTRAEIQAAATHPSKVINGTRWPKEKYSKQPITEMCEDIDRQSTDGLCRTFIGIYTQIELYESKFLSAPLWRYGDRAGEYAVAMEAMDIVMGYYDQVCIN